MCFSKRHWEGIFRGQSCVWVWQGCCACSMNQMPSDDVLYRNIYTQGTEKGLEGAPGIIKLSSWLPQTLCPNSQYEFADRTRYSHLPLAPQPHDTAHHMQAGCPAPLPVCESCFLTLHLLTEPLRLSCVPEKPLKGQAVLFPKLSTELYKQDLYTLLLLQLHLFVLLFPRPLLKHLRCQFPRVDPHFTSFTACPMPRALSSLISSLPHIRAFHSFASLVTRVVTWTLLLQKCSVFSDFCLPHPRWLQHQLHGPKVIQKRQEVMSHNLWHWYLHFPLFAFTVKGAGMGYHPDTAHISSVNYKQENLCGGCGQFPKTASVFSFSWPCTSGSPSSWSWGSTQQLGECSVHGHEFKGHKKCRDSWSHTQRLAVPDELGTPFREQAPESHSPWKKNQPKGMKGDKFLTNHTFPAIPTNYPQEIHLFFYKNSPDLLLLLRNVSKPKVNANRCEYVRGCEKLENLNGKWQPQRNTPKTDFET